MDDARQALADGDRPAPADDGRPRRPWQTIVAAVALAYVAAALLVSATVLAGPLVAGAGSPPDVEGLSSTSWYSGPPPGLLVLAFAVAAAVLGVLAWRVLLGGVTSTVVGAGAVLVTIAWVVASAVRGRDAAPALAAWPVLLGLGLLSPAHRRFSRARAAARTVGA